MDVWELVARERIRDGLAQYNWAGDAGRVDDLADAFSPDGILEIRGFPPLQGRAAIVEFLGGVTAGVDAPAAPDAKRVVRHNVANIRFTAVRPDRAEVSSYFTVVTHIGLDHFGRYRDVFVPDGDRWLISHRKVSTDWSAPNSVMAR